MIYSAAKNNPSLNIAWARKCDEGLPRPDLVVFLDLEIEEAERRGGYGEEKYEKREMQERVRELYGALREVGGDEREDMVVVDAGEGVEVVAGLVGSVVRERVGEVEAGNWRDLGVVRAWGDGVMEKIPQFRGSKS